MQVKAGLERGAERLPMGDDAGISVARDEPADGMVRIRELLRVIEQSADADPHEVRTETEIAQMMDVPHDRTAARSANAASEEGSALLARYEGPMIIAPVRFGELVPRVQLFPGEIVALNGLDRANATTLRIWSFAAVRRWFAYLAAGWVVGGGVFLGLLYAQEHPTGHHRSEAAARAVIAAETHARTPHESPGSINIVDDAARRHTIRIDEHILADPAVAFVWLRNVPDGAVVSQGLSFANGNWLLSKAQLHNLVIKVPTTVPDTHVIMLDIANIDNVLITQMSLGVAGTPGAPTPR